MRQTIKAACANHRGCKECEDAKELERLQDENARLRSHLDILVHDYEELYKDFLNR